MLFRAALTSAVAATALAASAPSLEGGVSDVECSKYTKGDGLLDAACPVIFQTAGVLFYQANNINTNADKIVATLAEAIGSDNPVTKIINLATEDLVSNAAYGAGVTLYGLGGSIKNVGGACRCDLSSCLSALDAANEATRVDSQTSQAACAQAQYACSDYYSAEQVEAGAPLCANYEGTTSSGAGRI